MFIYQTKLDISNAVLSLTNKKKLYYFIYFIYFNPSLNFQFFIHENATAGSLGCQASPLYVKCIGFTTVTICKNMPVKFYGHFM